MNEAEGEGAETQVWAAFALECGYMPKQEYEELQEMYAHVLRMLVKMISHPEPWLIRHAASSPQRRSS